MNTKYTQKELLINVFNNLIDDGTGGPEIFDPHHFAEGSCRYAYCGIFILKQKY